MVRTPFAGASACLLIGGGDQMWQMWLLPSLLSIPEVPKAGDEIWVSILAGALAWEGRLAHFLTRNNTKK